MDSFKHPELIEEYNKYCKEFAQKHGLNLHDIKSKFLEDIPGMKQGWEDRKNALQARKQS